MGKGLPKKYAKMGFKKGWAAYRKTKGGRKKTTRTKSAPRRKPASPRKRRTVRTTARRRKSRRSRSMKIPIATTVGLALTGLHLYNMYNAGGNTQANMIKAMTGYDYITETFQWKELLATWGPVTAGALISKYVGGPKGLNVNASLRNVPLIKL